MKRIRKCFGAILIIAMILTTLSFAVVKAESNTIVVASTEVYPGDTVKISAPGANEDYYLAIYKPNSKDSQYLTYAYIRDLGADNTWSYTAPNEPGEYEVRLLDTDDKSVAVYPVKIKVKLREATFKLSAATVTPESTVKVTVGNVPDTNAYIGTTVLLYKVGSKVEQYIAYKPIDSLPADNTWEVKMPRELGKYYFAVHQNDDYDKPMGVSETVEIVPFTPTITLNKLKFKINEPIKIGFDEKTVPKFDFEIRISKADSKQDAYETYINRDNLPADNIYSVKMAKSGTYQARFFYSDATGDVNFGTSKNFVVSDEAMVDKFIGASDWAKTEIADAVEYELTTPNSMVDFQAPISREEFCELVVKLYEKLTGNKAQPAAAGVFSDTNNVEVLKAYKLGIVDGIGDGKFGPQNSITREQIATMFLRTIKAASPKVDTSVKTEPTFFDKDEVSSWAKEAVNFFAYKEIIKGSDGYFLPKANCTKEAAIALVLRTYNNFSK